MKIEDRSLFSKTGNSIYNDEVRAFLEKNVGSFFSQAQFAQMNSTAEYCQTFLHWIKNSKLNQIQGLETFPFCEVSLGVTQSLDAFHYEILLQKRRLRLFKGEYPYNRDVHPFDFESDFLDSNPLKLGDAVILSCPFSGSGTPHPSMCKLIKDCEKLEVPIFLDMAWFGTCAGLNLDLRSPAIRYVSFSLTKSLSCGNYRSGIRLRRHQSSLDVEDRLTLQHEWSHGIHLNTFIGTQLMRHFSADYHFLKYRDTQLKVCQDYGLKPSDCVHIALGDESWEEFHRDGAFNRINLRDAIKRYQRKSN